MTTPFNFWNDFRYSVRRLLARPGFAAVVVLTLAIGIGVNVTTFSLLQQILLRPLPVPEPNQLVNLTDPGPDLSGPQTMNVSGGADSVFSYPMFRDLESRQQALAGIAAHRYMDVSLSTGEEGQLDNGFLVSGSYFSVLGLRPVVGRLLNPQDDRVAGQAEAVVLSHAYWQSAFGSDPGAVGRTLIVSGVPLTIVGVAPVGFHGNTVGVRASVFLPITFRWLDVTSDDQPDDRTYRWLYLFGRLPVGIGLEEAGRSINSTYRTLLNEIEAPLYTSDDAQEFERFRTKSLVLEPGVRGHSPALGRFRERIDLLFAMSGIVLLLCCANVVGLILVRGVGRQGELAVRASLGAKRGRLASLLLIESVVLALPAALAGLPIALLALRGMSAGIGELAGIPPVAYDVNLDPGAILVAIGIAVGSALVFGLLPALQALRTEPIATLQASGSRLTAQRTVTRFSTVLATAQVALSMALLAMAAVFAQSLSNIARTDLGLNPEQVVMFSLAPGTSGYTTEASAALYDRLEEEIAAIPGVASVATSEFAWLGGGLRGGGAVAGPANGRGSILLNYVSHDFFDALGIRLLAGRDFTTDDTTGTPGVAIVNESFAERFGLGAADSIGELVTVRGASARIVGLAADAKLAGVTAEFEPQVFQPRRQSTELATATFYVRSPRPPQTLMNDIRATVTRVDPVVPMTGLRPMDEQIADNVATERFVAATSMVFAVLATALAGLGLYGVLAWAVAQRSREIGLRLALGAPIARIRGMVFRRVWVMAVAGVILGSGAAVLLSRAASSLLFGLEGLGPTSLAGGAGVLLIVTLSTAHIPARRASRIDPIVALRYE